MLTYTRLGRTNRLLGEVAAHVRDTGRKDDETLLVLLIAAGAVLWPLAVWAASRRAWAGAASLAVAVVLSALLGWPVSVMVGVPVSLVCVAALMARA